MAADNRAFADVFNVISVHGGLRKIRVGGDALAGFVLSLVQGGLVLNGNDCASMPSIHPRGSQPPYFIGLTYQVCLISLS